MNLRRWLEVFSTGGVSELAQPEPARRGSVDFTINGRHVKYQAIDTKLTIWVDGEKVYDET